MSDIDDLQAFLAERPPEAKTGEETGEDQPLFQPLPRPSEAIAKRAAELPPDTPREGPIAGKLELAQPTAELAMKPEVDTSLISTDDLQAFVDERAPQDRDALRQRATGIINHFRSNPDLELPEEWKDSLAHEAIGAERVLSKNVGEPDTWSFEHQISPTDVLEKTAKGISEAFVSIPSSKAFTGVERIPVPIPTWETTKAAVGMVGGFFKGAAQFAAEQFNPFDTSPKAGGGLIVGGHKGAAGLLAMGAHGAQALGSGFEDDETRVQRLKEIWQFEHDSAVGNDKLAKAIGYEKGSAPGSEAAAELGVQTIPFLAGGEVAAAGKLIPKVSEALVEEALPRAVGAAGVAAPVVAKTAVAAGAVAGAVAHPLLAAQLGGGALLVGGKRILKTAAKFLEIAKGAAPEAESLADASVLAKTTGFKNMMKELAVEGGDAFPVMKNRVSDELARMRKSMKIQTEDLGEKVNPQKLAQREPNGKFTVADEELNPQELKLRDQQRRYNELQGRYDTLDKYDQASRFFKDTLKLGVNAGLTTGAGGAAMGSLAALSAMPDEVEEVAKQGAQAGVALSTPALIMGVPEMLATSRTGRMRAAGDYMANKGASVTDPNSAKLTPNGQRTVNMLNGSVMESGHKFVAVDRETMSKITGAKEPPAGKYDPETKTAYLRDDLVEKYGQTGVAGHELGHVIDSVTADSATKAYSTILDEVKSPDSPALGKIQDFMYNYMDALRRSDPMARTLTPDALMREGAAELTRYILSRTPLEEIFAGKSLGHNLKRRVGDAIDQLKNRNTPEIGKLSDKIGFGAPFTRQQYNAMEDAIYNWARKVKRGGDIFPDAKTSVPQLGAQPTPVVDAKLAADVARLIKHQGFDIPAEWVGKAIQEAGPNAAPADIVINAFQMAKGGAEKAAPAVPPPAAKKAPPKEEPPPFRGRAGTYQLMPEKGKAEVNIGLHVGKEEKVLPNEAVDALKAAGVKVEKFAVHRPSKGEPTVWARISRPLTPKEGNKVSIALNQESIAQHVGGGKGALHGPFAKKWGPFKPEFFVQENARSLAENMAEGKTGQPAGPTRLASGVWDSTFVSGEGEAKRAEAAAATGADPKKHFFEQKKDVQQKIKDYFKSKGEAQFMPSPAGELRWTSRHYDMTPDQLEQFLVFGKSVAGKRSAQRAPMIERFMTDLLGKYGGTSPLAALQKAAKEPGGIEALVAQHKFSPYQESIPFLKHLAENRIPDLKNITEEELQNIPHIGPKTARFFKMHTDATRSNNVALDTHILSWLRDNGFGDAPRSTPQDPATYQRWSEKFREAAEELGTSPSDLDLRIWLDRSGNLPKETYQALESVGAGRQQLMPEAWFDREKMDKGETEYDRPGGFAPPIKGEPYEPFFNPATMEREKAEYDTSGGFAPSKGWLEEGGALRRLFARPKTGEPYEPFFNPKTMEHEKAEYDTPGGFAPRKGEAQFMPEKPFYSKLEQTVEEKMPDKASPEQVKALLAKSGVKKAEMDWNSPLNDLLDQDRTLTKREVLAAARAGTPEIREHRLSSDATPKSYNSIANQMYGKDYEALNASQKAIVGDTFTEAAQYDQPSLNLPGGENYRELLMKLERPQPKSGLNPEEYKRFTDLLKKRYGDLGTQQGMKLPSISGETGELKALRAKHAAGLRTTPEFTSGHFEGEPNVVGWSRVDDRVDPVTGGKMLFSQEFQSDWDKAARLEGVRPKDIDARLAEAKAGKTAYINELKKEHGSDVGPYLSENMNDAWLERLSAEQTSKLADLMDKVSNLQDLADGVPDMPFKGEGWKRLMLRNLIKHAVEGGYDSIGWTTGKQQAERYDLSKQIHSLTYARDPSGAYTIEAKRSEHPGAATTLISHNGSAWIEPKDLPSVIGKELADKIINAEGHLKDAGAFTGLDLQVGGEGKHAMYDKMFPQLANELGKKHGARVGPAEIDLAHDASNNIAKEFTYGSRKEIRDIWNRGGEVFFQDRYGHETPISNPAEAEAYVKANGEPRSWFLGDVAGKDTVHRFPITDSMRAEVAEKGQPMFMPSPHPDAIEHAAIRRNEDGKIYTTAVAGQPHHMIPMAHGEAVADYHGPQGHNLYEEGFTDKHGTWHDREQAFAKMQKLNQLPAGYQPEYAGEASAKELRAAQHMPEHEFDPNFKQAIPASDEATQQALHKNKAPLVGAHRDTPKGTPLDVRIDIPAYLDHGVYVQSIHNKGIGTVQGYDSIVHLDGPVTLHVNEGAAQRVKEGISHKKPFAVARGDFNPSRELPADINDTSKWTPAGFNPMKHSYFYDKETGAPVAGGSEAVMTGNTAYVKNARFAQKGDYQYMPENEAQAQVAIEEGKQKFPEAYPRAYKRDADGNLVKAKNPFNKKMEAQPILKPFDLKKSGLYFKTGDEDSFVKAMVKKVVDEHNNIWTKDPNTMAARGWYDVYKLLKEKGLDHEQATRYIDLLSATSGRQRAGAQFNDALEAHNRMEAGDYDEILKNYKQASDQYEKGELKDDKGNPITKPSQLSSYIYAHDWLPRKSTGAKFGMHSYKVLKTLAGQFSEVTKGLKYIDFANAMHGISTNPVIDIWSYRSLDRMANEGYKDVWRRLPENEPAVNDADYLLSRRIMTEAAKELGYDNPTDLQAINWFGEKKLWFDNGWARDLDLSDYRPLIHRLEPVKGVKGTQFKLNAPPKPPKTAPRQPIKQRSKVMYAPERIFAR